MIERLVIGSTNPAKLEEWQKFLKEIIKVILISELGNFPEPQETGKTFQDNAWIKARHYALLIHEHVFSEDGGYEVDALGGLPGVKSRRILPGDKDGTDQELINYVLEKVKGLPPEKRGVKLTSAAALSDPLGNIIFEDISSSVGVIAEKPGLILIPGYPFRSIHWFPELGKTYAELTEEEHERYNHKKPVAEKLTKFLEDLKTNKIVVS